MKIIIIIDITIFVDNDNLIYVIFFVCVSFKQRTPKRIVQVLYNIFKSRQIELLLEFG